MGEVYRAKDTELKRDVAIKTLSDEVARDAGRVARFEREARLLASINHTNIGGIFGVERKGGRLYLVLELIEGETLHERLASGELSLREVLALFRQIALALEAAHAKGIVHRDLKPDNVKITADGTVKVLDFGLAKLAVAEPARDPGAKTKTAPSRMTREGDILGTPAYMSPEQARGQTIDKRTDIWAFGCCLFEALAGRLPFQGKSISDVIVAVLTKEPDFGALPAGVPRNIRNLLRRCLQKDANKRLHDIGDARLELEEPLDEPDSLGPEAEPRKLSAWIVAGLLLATAVGWILGKLSDFEPPRTEPVRRFTIELSPTEPVALGEGPSLAISRDGTRIIFVAGRGDATTVRMRTMDRLGSTEVPGTEGATAPLFSPEGDAIGFFSGGRLSQLSLGELRPRTIAESPNPRGASWGNDGVILFSPSTVSGLEVTSAESSSPEVLTTISSDGDERSHRWPFLLDRGSALFTSWRGDRFDIEHVSLSTAERTRLIEDGTYPRFTPTGHLLFVRNDDLMAVPLDPDVPALRGEPVVVVENLQSDIHTGAAFYDVSADGTLVYVPRTEDAASEASSRLLRVDRQGTLETLLPLSRGYQVPRLSPDGGRLILTVTEDEVTDLYLANIDRSSMSRFTFEGNNGVGVWTPDGSRIAFSSDREGGPLNLFSKSADGTGRVERLTASPNQKFPTSWSADGKTLAYTQYSGSDFDVWTLDTSDGARTPFLDSSFNESAAVFSPDGRYLAHVSDETGVDEVYVRAFPGPGGKWMISSGGGVEPVWHPDGSELYYRNEEWVMAVSVEASSTFEYSQPRHLFEAPSVDAMAPYASYDVTPDGDFIMVRSEEGLASTRLVVVTGWFEELTRRVPTAR